MQGRPAWLHWNSPHAELSASRGAEIAIDAPGLRALGYERTFTPPFRRSATSTQILPVTKGRDRLMKMVRDAHRTFERFILTRDGVPQAVLMSYDEFEGWLETLEICQSKRVVREILRARKAADRGKTRSFEEVFGKPL